MRAHRRTTPRVGELLVLLLLVAASASAEVTDGTIYYRIGDPPVIPSVSEGPGGVGSVPPGRRDPSLTLGMTGWTKTRSFETLPQKPGDTIWVRVPLDLTDYKRAPGRPFGLYYGGLASHEIWWDGVKIGSGGVVGRTKEAEVPGPIETHYQVPDALVTPARHEVTLRMSAFHRGFSPIHGFWGIIVGNYDKIVAMRTRSAYIALAAMSGIALTAVFAFALFWLTRRDPSFLLLGALCIAAAALLMAEAWRPLFGYTYDWHIVRLRCVVSFSWLTGVLLVALVVTRFPGRFGRATLIGTAVVAAIVPWFPGGWDPKSLVVFMVCMSAASMWTVWAAARRMHGSVLALIGVGASTAALFLYPWYWVDNSLYFALNFLFLCLLCSHALEVRREQHEKARLQLEMLRRQLQPHFLMNTLTALSEWIEQEPKTAVRMIDSLADELRILGAMSSEKLVSAEDELRLCRSHLANMSLRKDVAYELEVDGVDAALRVPPAVFHTLVENAVTHATAAERVTLRLSAHKDGSRVRYVFEAPLECGGSAAAFERGGAALRAAGKWWLSHRTPNSGTGTKYIEARLREAWGNAWSFRQGRAGSLWRAEIEVPA